MGSGFPAQPAKAAPPVASQAAVANARLILGKRMQSGASWFFWIAGLSLINSISSFSGAKFRFIMGLGVTQLTDALAGGSASPAALAFALMVAGLLVGFGLLARGGRDWAFILGMILYGLDSLIFLLAKDVISIGFHLLALYFLYRGLKANEALKKLTGTPAAA